jgi:hypothetical protein
MYLRTVRVKKKDRVLEYVQLAHNYRDPETRKPFVKVLYNFGRADLLDTDALRRLVRSISRYLEPSEAKAISERLGEEWPFEFLGSRQLGGAWLLDGLWKRLGIEKVLKGLLAGREYTTPVERLIFAMVANRALAPSSKLAMESWVAEEALIDGLPEVEVHQLYRAMDFLLEAGDEIQFGVFSAVADLFNLEVDLIFLDTTSTFFEIEGEDEGEGGLRKWGFSKDKRSDLAQVVVGFAVTRTGIPVRSWVWPGNTPDKNVVEEVKRDLNGWKLGRVVLVGDAGFNSEENRRVLQGAGGHYILGEKLRAGRRGLPVEALSRAGSYRTLENGLEIKEVILGGDSEARRRFVVVRNPEEAERDRRKREDIVAETQRRLDELVQLNGEPHRKAACELRAHPAYGRYIRLTRTGKLRLDKAKIQTEERFDGKFLVSSSDDGLSAEDIVLGYKQLWAVERIFRDLKHRVDIRPVYHRLADRIRAHVLLCWLSLLLIRVAENATGETWYNLKRTLASLQMGIHRTRSGEVRQATRLTAEQTRIFEALGVPGPPRYYTLPKPKRSSV